MNRRTPEEIIKKGNPKTEQAYIKFPREELIKVSHEEDDKEYSTKTDMKLITNILGKDKIHNKYTHIHTHHYLEGRFPNALPSGVDLKGFYDDFEEKVKVIAQKNVQTGDVLGYTVLLKKDNVKKPDLYFGHFKEIYSKSIIEQTINYDKKIIHKMISPEEGYNELKEICEKQKWGLRFVPAKGYYFNKGTGNFEKKQGIEGIVASAIGGFIVVASLFNLYKLNAFAISENASSPSKYFVLIFITFALIFGIFIIFRKNKWGLR